MTFKERGEIGDNAECRAESYFKKGGYFITRYGIDAKDLKDAYVHWKHLPSLVASTPDFIVVTKLHDIDNYKEWNGGIFPNMKLILFIYSATHNEHHILSFDKILNLVKLNNYAIDRYENNKKPFYIIPLEDLG